MTSLAVIFVLLLIVFMKSARDQSQRSKNAVTDQLKELADAKNLPLHQDPNDPLSLVLQVGEDQLRFPVGGATLSDAGSRFIDDFIPRAARRLCDPKTRKQIDSILIEGHTDRSGESTLEGVRRNIALSQKRSFSVLERGMSSIQADRPTYECLLELASASGRGSARPVLVDGEYDADRSRRVDIRIRVRSSEQAFKDLVKR